jgi:hypothetical protein
VRRRERRGEPPPCCRTHDPGHRGRSRLAPARIDPDWRYHDLRALVLEDARLRLVVLPEMGAKLFALIDKRADRDVLWHNPARMEKWIRLEGDSPVGRVRHRLTNVGTRPMDFVWGIHPCFGS